MRLLPLRNGLPGWKDALLALLSAILLFLAFPDFDYWFLAWIALVPLMWAVDREKESTSRPFILGWIFGTVFFFATCWWLTYAPITYAAFPPILAYFLLFLVCAAAGLFPAIFAAILSISLRRFGPLAFLAAPLVWVFTEFLRYWITGNNWNALAYSQAFGGSSVLEAAGAGGVYLTGFIVMLGSTGLGIALISRDDRRLRYGAGVGSLVVLTTLWLGDSVEPEGARYKEPGGYVIALQPNVPMAGLTYERWQALRTKHLRLAETALGQHKDLPRSAGKPVTVIFPESPMNFMYESDVETKEFIDGFARNNNVSVLFNSAEPDAPSGKFYNSAVMVGPQGGEIAQYDKIYLLPFGEAVPFPLEGILPGFVGNFSYGREYDLLPLGDARAGVMICFESHFGSLSREYVRNGADAIIEMTNDGYLGPTPVLRQHLANAVFRAVETNRPVLRVTNVGITAYINERGEVLDAAQPYTEDTRVWSVARSDGTQTLYVRYGDWFAWLSTLVTLVTVVVSLRRRISAIRQEVQVQMTAIS